MYTEKDGQEGGLHQAPVNPVLVAPEQLAQGTG